MCDKNEQTPNLIKHRYDHYDNLVEKLDIARQKILGTRNMRTKEAIWFESQNRAKPQSPRNRCYGLATMTEKVTKIEALPAKFKVYDNNLDEALIAVQDIVKVIKSTIIYISYSHI